MRPLKKVRIKWSPEFAYAIGLLVTDGSLSSDGRHIDFSSQDLEQLENFKKCLGIDVKIGYKISGLTRRKNSRLQFGDVNLYKFLLKIGLMVNKSKIIADVIIPNEYFFDFLRGHLDGDGTFFSYWDKRWRSSFMFYTAFLSASEKHIRWIQREVDIFLQIKGNIKKRKTDSVFELKYGKKDSLVLLPKLYYSDKVVHLTRKYNKVVEALNIVNNLNNAQVL